MKGRVLIIGEAGGRTTAALVVDGRLEDFLRDPPPEGRLPGPGDLVTAVVGRPAGPGAAFARWRDGPAQLWLREGEGLRQGSELVVQVTGHAEPGKAIPCSARPLIKSRRVIFTPTAPGVNVSRKIRDEAERGRLAEALAPLAEAGGFILRTAAMGAAAAELRAEAGALVSAYAGRGDRRFLSAATVAQTEWTDPLPDWIGFSGGAAPAYPELEPLARPADGDSFEYFGVWEAVAALSDPRTDLPGGAFMFVEPTRACVTVDVNTGGDFSPAAALKANLAAIRELPRQLRLRGLGGQVLLGPAPTAKRDRMRIETALKAAFRADPVETMLAGWTPLGNVELQRKRERRPLAELMP
ncbi:MAG TPA: ribonuclease E/G [Paracoccaceae bacterium]|nr:ribonuclease E/G [Paracoccaceae bacterium]